MERCLENLDITDANCLDNWKERFDLYVITNDKITAENQTAFYLTLIGKEAYNLLKDLAYPEALNIKTVPQLHTLLQNHLRPTNFAATERAKFHNLVRRSDETLRAYLLRLQQQAARCDFGDQLQIQLRDRMVAGVNEVDVQRRLLREQQLTYASARTILETWEDVNTALDQTANVLYGLPNRRPYTRRSGPQQPRAAVDNMHDNKATSSAGLCNSCGGSH